MKLLGTDRDTGHQVKSGREGERTGTSDAKVRTHGRDNPQVTTRTLAKFMAKKGGASRQVQRQQKRACGVGIQGLRGTLRINLRAARKGSAETDSGIRREWEISMWTVHPILEERGRVGCNIVVNISRMVAYEGSEGSSP